MQLSSRSLIAVAAFVLIEGLVMLAALAVHGKLSLGDVASTLGIVIASAVIAGLALRWTSGSR